MEKDKIINELKQLLVDELDLDIMPEEIGNNDSFVDSQFRLDSLDFLTIAAAIEDKYGTQLDFKDNKNLYTVDGIADYIISCKSA